MNLFFHQKYAHVALLVTLFIASFSSLAPMPGSDAAQAEQDESSAEQQIQQGPQQSITAAPPAQEASTPVQQIGADGGELSDKDLNTFAVRNQAITELQKQAKEAISRMDELLAIATKTRDELQTTYFSLIDEINTLPPLTALEASLPPSP